ncbi:AfsR/SARP family transcriptional regulator [Streptomyces sp. MI02-7b]|uniref:AfsR/SARP family transcriptional regulator n=1 Tax=Streptomyces sp. MI02-7b TaxID=462941 RepID=UPI0029A6C52C|nr:BTAD domain-containing putative transcriptional regulator [Streptomyces sp. MI02-7b]MDX3078594.1 BTAD domain-containing putative transcriptional regulator [Streptomyces sp. MI02-7b]
MLQIRLLGPVKVWAADRLLDAGSPRQRAVLAVLAMEAGQPVPLESIADDVWDGTAPAAQTVYVHISRIRRMLRKAGGSDHRPPTVLRPAGGYQLDIDPEQVDVHRFQRLVDQANRPELAEGERAQLLHDALDLWQGTPLSDLQGAWADRMRWVWHRKRLDAMIGLAQAEVRLGNAAAVVGPLTDLIAEHPLVEPLAAVLMQALHGSGRTAEALDRYALTRTLLADSLGIDPGQELQRLHEALLRGELEQPSVPPARPRRLVPAQLPAGVRTFTGREAELAELDRRVFDAESAPKAVVISAIGGTAGVGKTALALHWAHRVAHRFPDGQLYVDLRGYDPDLPMTAADALAQFLLALDVAQADIPIDVDARAARYRTEVVGRRMLIVIDNAASAEQIRPLLPGAPSCAVVVTSRDRLAGLVVKDGARRLDLDLLPAADAYTLLRTLIGSRVGDDPVAAGTLATQCARLPLALRVAAELAVTRPDSTLAELVTELADQQHRLSLLQVGDDPYTTVGAVFGWSLRHLSEDVADIFRLLGLHPGPVTDAYTVAALADVDPERSRKALNQLAQVHLVHRIDADRYGMHDLLRAYATSLIGANELSAHRRAAQQRLFGYYLAATTAAMNRLYPADSDGRLAVPETGAAVPALDDSGAARRWLDAERCNLVAISGQTGAAGWAEHTMRLSVILYRYLAGGFPTDAAVLHGHAREAARRLGDLAGEAQALLGLGGADIQLSQYASAAARFERSFQLFRQVHDSIGEARALANLGAAQARLGDLIHSVRHHAQALEAFRRLGDRTGEARALISLSVAERQNGDYDLCAHHIRQALELHRQADNQSGIAFALTNLGTVETQLGELGLAAEHLRHGLDLFRKIGNQQGMAYALDRLGIVHTQSGDSDLAVQHHERALELFRQSGDRHGQALALNGLGEAALQSGNAPDALTHHKAALAVATSVGDMDQQARAHAGVDSAQDGPGDLTGT